MHNVEDGMKKTLPSNLIKICSYKSLQLETVSTLH